MNSKTSAEAPASANGKLRARDLLPRFELGRISGATLTMGQPGDGWYVALQWLGRAFIFETLRAMPDG